MTSPENDSPVADRPDGSVADRPDGSVADRPDGSGAERLGNAVEHPDKYNDPRVAITPKGVMLVVLVLVFGIGGAAYSIWARKAKLGKTREFWGGQVILAFQLAEEVELIPKLDTESSEPVRLSGMPGLGHLRRVFLDERSYEWESVGTEPITTRIDQEPCMMLRLTDPTAHRFDEVHVVVAMESGWVGLESGKAQVRFNERFQKAVPVYLERIANYEPLRAEVRERKSQQQE